MNVHMCVNILIQSQDADDRRKLPLQSQEELKQEPLSAAEENDKVL